MTNTTHADVLADQHFKGTVGAAAGLMMIPILIMSVCSLATFWKRPGAKLTAAMQHFAAGVVLAAVVLEMVPEIHAATKIEAIPLSIGFIFSIALLFGMKRLIGSLETGSQLEDHVYDQQGHLNIGSGRHHEHTKKGELEHDIAQLMKAYEGDQTGGAFAFVEDGTTVITEQYMTDETKMNMEEKDATDKEFRRDNHVKSSPGTDVRVQFHQQNPLQVMESKEDLALKDEEEEEEEDTRPKAWPIGLLAAVAVDGAVDGMLIGVSYITGAEAGTIAAVALGIEMGLLGASTSISLQKCNRSLMTTCAILFFLPWAIMMGGLFGVGVLSDATGGWFILVVGFGVGALLYLVTEELMIEAHEDEETDTWYVSYMFFLGFIFVVIFEYGVAPPGSESHH